MKHLLTVLLVGLLLPLARAQTPGPALTAFSSATGMQPPQPWRVVGVPGGKIPLTTYALVELDGRKVLRVEADKSYGNLVHDLSAAVPEDGLRLRWRWRLDEALRGADLRRREGDDSALKVCALFDMPLSGIGLIERNLLRLARAASGEKLPSATLCYVWDSTLAPGTLLANAYTARVRFIVLDSGEQRLGQWVTHSRDLGADFRRAFGEESNGVPPLQAVLVGADADNTGGRSLGHVGDVTLSP
ncbi:MAG: DUF3047 domain-containing protein [Polaromonas sp.]|uniref:DUF3047 domain-containing protein n=1 Tax=Polaromonas sp. TaxID=1869339 RepID=UPI0018573914|nr:DUF3047 domain-containing protein [Polaromonas sp.]MBA3594747.1 DUF3047 domain-containing protein [Polaromonas sp.]